MMFQKCMAEGQKAGGTKPSKASPGGSRPGGGAKHGGRPGAAAAGAARPSRRAPGSEKGEAGRRSPSPVLGAGADAAPAAGPSGLATPAPARTRGVSRSITRVLTGTPAPGKRKVMIKGDEGRGSKGALNADEGEEDDPFKAKCLISPASNFRLRWDLLMLVLIMYNVIIIPVRICFEWEAVPSDFLFWMETSMDFTFLVDVVLNFQSGFYNGDGDPVISRATIAKTYMKSWFWIDFPSSVPLDLIFLLIEEAMRPPEGTVVEADQDDNSKDFIQILKMLKFLRMVRAERRPPSPRGRLPAHPLRPSLSISDPLHEADPPAQGGEDLQDH